MSILYVGLATAAVSAGIGGAQIAEGKKQSKAALDSGNFFAIDPRIIENSELFGQLQQDIAATLGRGSTAEFGSSPFDIARSQIDALPGVSEKDKRRALVGLNFYELTGKEHNDSIPRDALRVALTRTDYGNIAALSKAAAQFTAEQAKFAAAYGPAQDQILQARIANELGIGRILTDFPSATPEDISSLTDTLRNQILERANAQVLEQANVSGINPAGLLGEVRRTADTDALQQALTLLGARQQLGTQELTTRLAGRAQPQEAATALLAILSNSLANAGSTVAQSQASAAQLRQNQQNVGTGLQQQGLQTIGQGVSDIGSLVLLQSILNKPGTGGVNTGQGKQTDVFGLPWLA